PKRLSPKSNDGFTGASRPKKILSACSGPQIAGVAGNPGPERWLDSHISTRSSRRSHAAATQNPNSV
ncbi:MAG: hypothetical protein AAF711_10925, partial [Planctomycetota bacterium]